MTLKEFFIIMKFTHYFLVFNIFITSVATHAFEDSHKKLLSYLSKKNILIGVIGGGGVLIAFLAWRFWQYSQSKTKTNKKKESKPKSNLISKGNSNESFTKNFLNNQSSTNQLNASSYGENLFIGGSPVINPVINSVINPVINSVINPVINSVINSVINPDEIQKKALLGHESGEDLIHLVLTNETEENLVQNTDIRQEEINILHCLPEKEDPALQFKYLTEKEIFIQEAISDNRLKTDLIILFNYICYLTNQKLLQELSNYAIIPRIFTQEMEYFKVQMELLIDKKDSQNKLTEQDKNTLINFLEHVQCKMYKYIFGKNSQIALYAPIKIHEEQMNFLKELEQTIELNIKTEPSKWSLLKNIFEQVESDIDKGGPDIDLIEKINNTFTLLCNQFVVYSEEIKSEVRNELSNLENIWKTDEAKNATEFIKNQLGKINILIEWSPKIDRSYLNYIKDLKAIFEKEINYNIINDLQIAWYRLPIDYPGIGKISLQNYRDIQKNILKKGMIFLEYYTYKEISSYEEIQKEYNEKYKNQVFYLHKNIESLVVCCKKENNCNAIIIKSKKTLKEIIEINNKPLNNLFEREAEEIDKNLKNMLFTDKAKTVFLNEFKEEAQKKYTKIVNNNNPSSKAKQRHGRGRVRNKPIQTDNDRKVRNQINYFDETILYFESLTNSVYRYRRPIISNAISLLSGFYNLSGDEAGNILDTEQKKVVEKIDFKDDNEEREKLMMQVIAYQNTTIAENNINIPIPLINQKFMKKS